MTTVLPARVIITWFDPSIHSTSAPRASATARMGTMVRWSFTWGRVSISSTAPST